jgi:hypothetical protein
MLKMENEGRGKVEKCKRIRAWTKDEIKSRDRICEHTRMKKKYERREKRTKMRR